MVRAYFPWPGVWTQLRLSSAGQGKIIKFLPNKMIQVEGKKEMSYKDFINGYPNADPTLIQFLKKWRKRFIVQITRPIMCAELHPGHSRHGLIGNDKIESGRIGGKGSQGPGGVLVQSLTFLAVPPTIILAACKFGLKIFLVLFLAWETLCPYITPLPQLKHIAAIDNFLG